MEVVDEVCEGTSDPPEQGESMETYVCEEEAARMATPASSEEHADVSAADPSTESPSTEPPKARFSYRLVFKQVRWKWLDNPTSVFFRSDVRRLMLVI